MPFGKRSVMETYFDFGLLSELETVISNKFWYLHCCNFLPVWTSSYTRLVRGNIKHWCICLYRYRKLSHNLTCCKNLFSSNKIIRALNFVDKCNGLHKSCITSNWFFQLVIKAYLVSGGQVLYPWELELGFC